MKQRVGVLRQMNALVQPGGMAADKAPTVTGNFQTDSATLDPYETKSVSGKSPVSPTRQREDLTAQVRESAVLGS